MSGRAVVVGEFLVGVFSRLYLRGFVRGVRCVGVVNVVKRFGIRDIFLCIRRFIRGRSFTCVRIAGKRSFRVFFLRSIREFILERDYLSVESVGGFLMIV